MECRCRFVAGPILSKARLCLAAFSWTLAPEGHRGPDELGLSEGFEPENNLRFAIGMRSTAPTSSSVHMEPEQIGAS